MKPRTKTPDAKTPAAKTSRTPERCCAVPPKLRRMKATEARAAVAAFRALGDPTRLEMWRLICANAEPICVCDIVARFHLKQPTISHHLKVLREAGLVTVSRRGVWAHYAQDPKGVSRAAAALASVLPGCCAQGD